LGLHGGFGKVSGGVEEASSNFRDLCQPEARDVSSTILFSLHFYFNINNHSIHNTNSQSLLPFRAILLFRIKLLQWLQEPVLPATLAKLPHLPIHSFSKVLNDVDFES